MGEVKWLETNGLRCYKISILVINHLKLTDTERTLHPEQNNTFFISVQEALSKLGHMLGCKMSLGKFLKLNLQNMFSDHNWVKLEITDN